MLKLGLHLTLLVCSVCVSGTIIYPTRGNHKTCKTVTCSYGTVCVQKVRYCLTSPCVQPTPTCEVAAVERSDACALLNCPQGSKCKQEVRQCASPPCQQPPPICIKVSTPSQPILCPPGMSPDLNMGRPRNCVSDGQCGSSSKCFSSNVRGPFICCSEKSATANLPTKTHVNFPPPHRQHLPAPQPPTQPAQRPSGGPSPNMPIPRINTYQQPVAAHQHVANQNQPPPTHHHHVPPKQQIVQPQRQSYPMVRQQHAPHHHHQPVQPQHTPHARHHTLPQPQAKPYAFINHQPSQHFHQGRNVPPPRYQTRPQEMSQLYLQSEPVNQPQRESMARRYPAPWSRQQRETEYAAPRQPEVETVEVNRVKSGFDPMASNNCPAGYVNDFQGGREIPCIQDIQCQTGSNCLSATGRRYVCCSRDASIPIQRRRPAQPLPRYTTQRKQIVSYGNRLPPPPTTRLSYPTPSDTFPVLNNSRSSQFQHSSVQQQRQPVNRLSFNSQYTPNKQPNVPYRIPGGNKQALQTTKKLNDGQIQVTCPSGYTANQVNGQNMVCASGSQCPEGSECKSTGLFQGSICCSKSPAMGQSMHYTQG